MRDKDCLPFTNIDDMELLNMLWCRSNCVHDENTFSSDQGRYLQDLAHKLATSAKDLKVAHINIRGLKNKIDELRVLLQLCRFDVFAITESHLKSDISDGEISIDRYNVLRRDRTNRKGGGCTVYYRKTLKAIRRMDLEEHNIEMICLQVKASSRDILRS